MAGWCVHGARIVALGNAVAKHWSGEFRECGTRRPFCAQPSSGCAAVVADLNFADLLEAVAESFPDRTAIIQGDTRRSWRECDERTNRLARHLIAAGLVLLDPLIADPAQYVEASC